MGGKSGGESQKAEPWGPSQEYIKQGMRDVQNLYGRGPSPFFPGQTYVDPNQLELAGRANQLGYGMGTGQGIVNSAQQAWANQANPMMNPWLDQTLQMGHRDIARNLGQNILPQLGSSASQAGQYGSSKATQDVGMAAQRAIEQSGDYTTDIMRNAYDQGIGQQQWAAQNAGNIYNLGLTPGNLMQTVGGQYRADQERQLADSMQRYNYEMGAPMEWAERYMGNMQPTGALGGKTSRQMPGGNPIAGAVGGGALGAGMLGPAIQSAAFSALGPGSGSVMGPLLMDLSGPWGMAAGGLLGAGLGGALS